MAAATSRKIISTDGNLHVASDAVRSMRGAYRIDVFTFTDFAFHWGGMDVSAEPEGVLKILLVDDEVLVRSGTAMMLDELGHEVIEASSGKQALEILADHPHFDLVVTDYRMPDMNGMELILEARKNIPALKAILMTGYEADDPRFADLQAGSLSKPFGLDDLGTAIRSAR
jgi:CheY-like chemotaxis protein